MKPTRFSIIAGLLFAAIVCFAAVSCAGCRGKIVSGSGAGSKGGEEAAGRQGEGEAAAAAGSEGRGEPKDQQKVAPQNIKEVYWSQVAGKFYPSSREEVIEMVDRYLADASAVKELEGRDIVGFISPHAGYIYSGPVAAWGYRQLKGRKISSVIILGFNHRKSPSVSSILPHAGYRTPLGTAPVDAALRAQLLKEGKGIVREDETPFGGEHSLEVQIPFIQRVLPQASIVPIMVAHPGGKVDEGLAKLLYKTVGMRGDVVIVASTDLSHYTPYDEAVKVDTETLKRVASLDWDWLAAEGPHSGRMCGYFTVGVLMKLFSLYSKEKKGTLVRYANSGDTSGDKSRGVVGYGVVVFSLPGGVRGKGAEGKSAAASAAGGEGGGHGKAEVEGYGAGGGADTMTALLNALSAEDTKQLQKLARSVIEAALKGENFTPQEPVSPPLRAGPVGAVVAIELDGRTHGVGKEMTLTLPLYRAVAQAALDAIVGDSRYPAPPIEKLPEISIKIFAVTHVAPSSNLPPEKIAPDGGILITSKWGDGIVPPGEAKQKGWDTEEALRHCCRRANLLSNCYKEKGRKWAEASFSLLAGMPL